MDRENSVENRRKYLRIPILVTRVKGNDRGKIFFGYAKDISRAGIFVQSINPKERGEQFDVEFTLPGDDEIISSRVEVVWNRGYSDNVMKAPPGMGLKFLDMEQALQDKIRKWVEMNSD